MMGEDDVSDDMTATRSERSHEGRDRPSGDRRGGPRRPSPRTPRDAQVRKKADELHDQGMPYQMAMAVAHGKLDLSEALERMATKDRVNKLMERHDLSRALATQVAIGHADLDKVLARRRLAEHRESYRDHTCLVISDVPVALQLHGGDTVKGTIAGTEAYTFQVQVKDATREIHKLEVKYAYAPGDWKKVKKAIKVDKKLAARGLKPEPRPQDRYSCSDKRLFSYLDADLPVVATLLEGDIVSGQVTWFGRYEFGLRIKGDVEITVFRHALHDLRPS